MQLGDRSAFSWITVSLLYFCCICVSSVVPSQTRLVCGVYGVKTMVSVIGFVEDVISFQVKTNLTTIDYNTYMIIVFGDLVFYQQSSTQRTVVNVKTPNQVYLIPPLGPAQTEEAARIVLPAADFVIPQPTARICTVLAPGHCRTWAPARSQTCLGPGGTGHRFGWRRTR